MISLGLSSEVLQVDGIRFVSAPPLKDLLSGMGSSAQREIELEDRGKKWRKVVVDDVLGFRILYDHEIDRCVDLCLCFDVLKCSFGVSHPFHGRVCVAGVLLAPGSSGRSLPTVGDLPFSSARAGWEATSENFFVYAMRGRDELLGDFSISFLKRPRYSIET
jgi:hypothetical protein